MSILGELQRRKVIRVAGVYLVASWLLLQIAATVAPIIGLPEWFERLVLVLLGLGLPVALIFAWAFEQTPDGLRKDSGGRSSRRSQLIDYGILVLLAAGLVYAMLVRVDSPPPAKRETLDRSVAVLPFENLNGDGSNMAFTAGIHSDLLTQLFRIDSIRTISRTTVLAYADSDQSIPEIASELNVATILEASVQRSGDNVRITAQLVNAADDVPMWNEVYDRELTAANIFAIQSEIAQAIGAQLQATLTGDDLRRLDAVPTDNIAALDSYFIGKEMLERRSRESLLEGIDYFEAAVTLDPNFALGWSGLADAYMLLPEYSHSADRELVERRAREGVLRALELNPDLPEVRASEAWYQLRFFDWDGAERIFREALAVAPDNTNALHWLSHTLSWQGMHEEAIALARRAVEVEPESSMMRTNLAYILVDAREFDEGLQIIREVRASDPDHPVWRRNLLLHELRAGSPTAAANTFVDLMTYVDGDAVAAREIGDKFVAFAEHGAVGNIDEQLIERAQLGSEDLAQVLAFVGDAEAAISALQAAAAEHSGSRSVFSMKINPGYDFIRDDPRFIALLDEVGLGD